MKLALYATPPQPCAYLPKRQSCSLFVDPQCKIDNQIYSRLIQKGFRRSGEHIYRPYCHECDDCIPLRIPVREFIPRRIQKRIWKRNRDLETHPRAARYDEEHFQLYQRYLHIRHQGSEMADPVPEEYLTFLTSSWSETWFYEFRANGDLVAVTVADRVDTGLSAVYTFFDPAHAARSPGAYAILWLIGETKRLGLSWLYLGYWIAECRKMSYKSLYRPFEIYRNGGWQPGERSPQEKNTHVSNR